MTRSKDMASGGHRASPITTFPVGVRNFARRGRLSIEKGGGKTEETMHGLIYLVGLIVVILAVLSFFGLR
ncbi:hypothetical protein IVB22_19890 [Bradyrhizobium sp. 190]|uniref:hypothetical protein n=1 Tax=Bradyrhizobium sp. 190 TaxID=2782658 RepID=UPI001FF946EF|nr:hypothetical protein [Bradyrhizobium sp. 190]MCK1514781.1 hypothetical protein [Bradyrhizobium sp. 190]